MILNCPEWSGGVTNTHYDLAIFRAIVSPRQFFKLGATGNIDVKGMVTNGLDGTSTFEQIFVCVVNLGNKPVFHD